MKRLESLDVLRGLDLFLLIILGPAITSLAPAGGWQWPEAMTAQFEHVTWGGFSMWDLIMPLFMFMSGITIPFSLDKYRGNGNAGTKVYLRILRRVVVLWILGMMCQGKLLTLDPAQFKYFSNTLQAIAVGYLGAALLYLHTGWKSQIGTGIALLVIYWLLMMTVGGGDFTPHGNLCARIDNFVLGSHRDWASIGEDGSVVFADIYTYTWILSSLNFIVTVLTGLLAGEVLKSTMQDRRKIQILLTAGALMVALGWIWNLQMPVIKQIWTSSMVLVSSGYCFLLMAVFYYLVDCKKLGRWFVWLNVFGVNSMAAYLIHELIRFDSIPKSLLYGLKSLVGPGWYGYIIYLCCLAITWWILAYMHRHKIYFKV